MWKEGQIWRLCCKFALKLVILLNTFWYFRCIGKIHCVVSIMACIYHSLILQILPKMKRKVYVVGTYMPSDVIISIKEQVSKVDGKEEQSSILQDALLDPINRRTIRIITYRSLSTEMYTNAIMDALDPLMQGEDMAYFREQFTRLNPGADIGEGTEISMIIEGDVMHYSNSMGGGGEIKSEILCSALCRIYYESGVCVSPVHHEEVLRGLQGLPSKESGDSSWMIGGISTMSEMKSWW